MKNEWHTIGDFKKYNESLVLLNGNENEIAKKKRTHMFSIMENSLHKHFKSNFGILKPISSPF